jgi:hypothetical protein
VHLDKPLDEYSVLVRRLTERRIGLCIEPCHSQVVALFGRGSASGSATIGLRRPAGTTSLGLRTRGITRRPAFRIGAPGGGRSYSGTP